VPSCHLNCLYFDLLFIAESIQKTLQVSLYLGISAFTHLSAGISRNEEAKHMLILLFQRDGCWIPGMLIRDKINPCILCIFSVPKRMVKAGNYLIGDSIAHFIYRCLMPFR
jgi:hypothetical protein